MVVRPGCIGNPPRWDRCPGRWTGKPSFGAGLFVAKSLDTAFFAHRLRYSFGDRPVATEMDVEPVPVSIVRAQCPGRMLAQCFSEL